MYTLSSKQNVQTLSLTFSHTHAHTPLRVGEDQSTDLLRTINPHFHEHTHTHTLTYPSGMRFNSFILSPSPLTATAAGGLWMNIDFHGALHLNVYQLMVELCVAWRSPGLLPWSMCFSCLLMNREYSAVINIRRTQSDCKRDRSGVNSLCHSGLMRGNRLTLCRIGVAAAELYVSDEVLVVFCQRSVRGASF